MIYLSKPYFDDTEIELLKETLSSGWVAGKGPKCDALSEIVKSITHTQYAIPVCNCTAALHLSLLALGITKGDDVLVSDYTFPATGHAVMYTGATPRFIDVELDTYNLDPALIESQITPQTKAMIIVHTFGHPADMDRINPLAEKYDLKIIEDAAGALGSQYKGDPVGSLGDIACFSFHPRKNITSGEGGVLVTNNRLYAEKVDALSNFGMQSAYLRQNQQTFSIPLFDELGYNYRLSDLSAALAIGQIKKLDKIIARKRTLVEQYNQKLQNHSLITVPGERDNHFHTYQSYVIILDPKIDRDKIILELKREQIQTQIGMFASHALPVYQSTDDCPNSLFLFKQSLALPLHYELSEDDIQYIVEKLLLSIEKM